MQNEQGLYKHLIRIEVFSPEADPAGAFGEGFDLDAIWRAITEGDRLGTRLG